MASSENRDSDENTIDVDGWDELLPTEPAAKRPALPKVPTVSASPSSSGSTFEAILGAPLGGFGKPSRPAAPVVAPPPTVQPATLVAKPVATAIKPAAESRSTIVADAAQIADVVRAATEARKRPSGSLSPSSRGASEFAPSPPSLNLSTEGSGLSRKTGLDFVRAAASESASGMMSPIIDAGVQRDELDTDPIVDEATTFDVDASSGVDASVERDVVADPEHDVTTESASPSHDITSPSVGAFVPSAPVASRSRDGLKVGIAAVATVAIIGFAIASGSSSDDGAKGDEVAAASVVAKGDADPTRAQQGDGRPDDPKPSAANEAESAAAATTPVTPAVGPTADAEAPTDAAATQPTVGDDKPGDPPADVAVPDTEAAVQGADAGDGGETNQVEAAPAGDAAATRTDADDVAEPSDSAPPSASASALGGDASLGYDDERVFPDAELLRVPPGTDETAARVFSSRTLTPGDRPPLGAVGTGGVHIDRIVVGTKRRGRGCESKPDAFKIGEDREVVVCFRVVLAHKGEKLTLRWRRGEETERRAFLPLKGTRVRNGRIRMPVRPKSAGDWVIEVSTRKGEVLAEAPFTIVAP